MTIASEVVPRISYEGDGSQTSFPYPWLVLASTDLAIYQNEVLKTLGVHYTLSSVGAPTGGNVVFSLAPASGDDLVFIRDTEATQNTTLSDTGPAGMVAIERALDRLTMLEQETRATLARAALLDVFSATQNPTLAEPVALGLLRWNSAGTGLEPVSAATILPSSATLPLAVTQGGTNAITALAARASLGVDGQVRKVLTNLTGVSLALGDVVALDTATDSAVVLGDTVSSKAQFAVALATIAHAATGEFLLSGIGLVNVTGTVTRGRYARKSATTKVAEDSGTLHGAATDAPAGSFGFFLTGGTVQVTARLFGFTYPGNTAPTILGLPRVIGLSAGNSSGTPDTQYDISATAAVVRDPSGGGVLVLPAVASRTLNIATVGPAEGGRDQAGAFSSNTWIHVYLIAKTDGTYHVTASLTAPPTGPAFPSGYTLWAYLGALRINNSSALIRSRLRGAWTFYEAAQVIVTDGRVTVETAVSVSSLVPPTALNWKLLATALNQRSSNQYPTFRLSSGGGDYDVIGITGVLASSLREEITFPQVSQQFYYLFGGDPTATYGLHAYVRGYENPV